MRTIEIRRLHLMTVVKVGFLVFFMIDFIGFLLYVSFFASIIGMALSGLGGEFGSIANIGGAALIFGGFFVALLAAVFQTLVLTVAATAYNVIANALGGILIEVVDTDSKGMPAAPAKEPSGAESGGKITSGEEEPH
jgi:hypothetical protein